MNSPKRVVRMSPTDTFQTVVADLSSPVPVDPRTTMPEQFVLSGSDHRKPRKYAKEPISPEIIRYMEQFRSMTQLSRLLHLHSNCGSM